MPNIKINLELKTSENYIYRKILQSLKPQVDEYLSSIFTKVQPKIIALVQQSIKNAPEYLSLQSGQLKAEFGIADSDTRLNALLEFWQNITAKYNKVSVRGNTLVGGFSISMIRSDYSDVLSSSVATVVTEKGKELNWLEWLLLFGNKTIIKDYTVELGPNQRSRTNMAIMKGSVSGKWSVPAQYSGTQDNNWITRSIDLVSSEIENLFTKELK
jgi:hypothetical protein